MGEVRNRIRAAVEAIQDAAVGLGEHIALRSPAHASAIDAAEAEFGHEFPLALRELYLLADGQSQGPNPELPMPLLGDLPFAPLGRALGQLRFDRSFANLAADAEPKRHGHESADREVRPVTWHHGRWPLAFFDGQETMYLDTVPTEFGQVGQLIVSGSHVFENYPWIGPGVLEFLEALANGIVTGMVVPRRMGHYAGGTRWHVGPAGLPVDLVGRALFDDPVGASPTDLPPEWAAWADRSGPRFGPLLAAPFGLSAVPPGTTDLTPLRRWPGLRWLDLVDTVTPTLSAIPDLPELQALNVRGVADLSGVERFPIARLMIVDSPAVDLTPLAARPGVFLEIDGPWRGDPPAEPVGGLITRAETAAEAQRALDLRPTKMLRLDLRDSNVDIAALDWSSTTAGQINVIGGRIESMAFVKRLTSTQYLSFFAPRTVDLQGLPADTEIEFAFQRAELPASPAELGAIRPPAGLSAPATWWHAHHAVTDPLIWNGFRGADEGSGDEALGWEIAKPRRDWMNAFYARQREEILARRRRDAGI
jgi:cell wall assembly regulator SMI1